MGLHLFFFKYYQIRFMGYNRNLYPHENEPEMGFMGYNCVMYEEAQQ